jgi:hypothetical protein
MDGLAPRNGVLLAFCFGYALTLRPLLHARIPLREAAHVAFAADTLSIAVMEFVDNGFLLLVPGAMKAGILFWWSLALALAIAFVAAFPVNRVLIARGMSDAGRDDDYWAAGDTDQARRDAAEERRLKRTASARADDDQLCLLLVGQVGEALGGEAGGDAPFRLIEPLARLLLLVDVGRRQRPRHGARRHRSACGVRGGHVLGDVGQHEPRVEAVG